MQDYLHEEDKHVLDIIGDFPVREFYDYLNEQTKYHKQYAHALDLWKFTTMQAQVCLALYDFAGYVMEGDGNAKDQGV